MGKTSLIDQGLNWGLRERATVRDAILVAKIDMKRLGGAQVTYRDFVHAIFEAVVAQVAAMGLGREVQTLRAITREMFMASQYQRGDRTEFLRVRQRARRPRDRVAPPAGAVHRRVLGNPQGHPEKQDVLHERIRPARPTRYYDMYIDVPFIHHMSSLLKDAPLQRQITFIVLVRPFIAEYDEREGLQLLKLMKPIMLRHLDETAAKEFITQPLEVYLIRRRRRRRPVQADGRPSVPPPVHPQADR